MDGIGRFMTRLTDVVKDWEEFLKTMKELEPYLVEFEMDGTIKAKNYPSDCEVGGEDRRPIIVITHDKYAFLSNNGICKAWTRIGVTFFRPKRSQTKNNGVRISSLFGRLTCLLYLKTRKKK